MRDARKAPAHSVALALGSIVIACGDHDSPCERAVQRVEHSWRWAKEWRQDRLQLFQKDQVNEGV